MIVISCKSPDMSSATPRGRTRLTSSGQALVERAEAWRWGSLWRRQRGSPQERGILSEWPVARRADWLEWVNRPQSQKELTALRESLRRGRPFGEPAWQAETAARLGLQGTFRPPGRPKKEKGEAEKPKKAR